MPAGKSFRANISRANSSRDIQYPLTNQGGYWQPSKNFPGGYTKLVDYLYLQELCYRAVKTLSPIVLRRRRRRGGSMVAHLTANQ